MENTTDQDHHDIRNKLSDADIGAKRQFCASSAASHGGGVVCELQQTRDTLRSEGTKRAAVRDFLLGKAGDQRGLKRISRSDRVDHIDPGAGYCHTLERSERPGTVRSERDDDDGGDAGGMIR